LSPVEVELIGRGKTQLPVAGLPIAPLWAILFPPKRKSPRNFITRCLAAAADSLHSHNSNRRVKGVASRDLNALS